MNTVIVEYYLNDKLMYMDTAAEKADMSYITYVRQSDVPHGCPEGTKAVCYPKDYSWQPANFEKVEGEWVAKV